MDSVTLAPEFDETLAAPAASPGLAARAGDFIALTKPRMNFLVVATTGVGYFMAARGGQDWSRLLNTLIGTALTAGGASVFNQYAERSWDRRMVRTHDRPLPAGRVLPLEALTFGILLSAIGILELRLFVNSFTAAVGAFTLASYIFVYTPLKRYSTLCTIVGAVPGALPIVMGWTAVRGALSPEALALFGILFFWQMPHFLAIAILYRDDYAAGGFKMLPVVDAGLRTTAGQIVLYSAALIPVSLLPGMFHAAGAVYMAAAIALGAMFGGFGLVCALNRGRAEARQLFLASIAYLPLLLGVMMMDKT